MLIHFIKRDFQSFKFYWSLLLGATLLTLPLIIKSTEFLNILAFAYFLFALVPLNQLIGSSWKNQKMLSRNYLLQLPINRNTHFKILLGRSLFYWIPFLIVMSLSSVLTRSVGTIMPLFNYSPLMAMITIVLASLWLTMTLIHLQLLVDQTSFHLELAQRRIIWFRLILTNLIEFSLVAFLFRAHESYTHLILLGPLLILGLVAANYRRSFNLWIHPRI